jgi:glycosyltransferase involved in cell wall biosynthesis
VYRELAERFQLSIFTAGVEGNRETWRDIDKLLPNARVERSCGFTLAKPKEANGRIFDIRYLHITPGYVVDLVRYAPDAIITNEMGFRTVVALLYGTVFGKPVSVWWGGTLHTERQVAISKRLLRALITRWARCWISYGQTSTEYLIQIGVPRERILQIQNCVDESAFTEATLPAFSLTPSPVLLYVGQMTERKGVGLLLETVRRAQKEGYQFSLLLVGGGPEKSRYELMAKELNIKNVHFMPSQPPERMPAVYRSADCLVFPTLEDVWGLVVNEALWSGLPVVSSLYAGCAQEIVPPDNRFDPLDPHDFDRAFRMVVRGRVKPPDTSVLLTCNEVAQRIIAYLASHP